MNDNDFILSFKICLPFHLFQGDRGFDGLPGLPGEKGHRVSLLKEKQGFGKCSRLSSKIRSDDSFLGSTFY